MSISSGLRVFGKYLDQPALVKRVYDKMPLVISASALAIGVHDTFNAPKKERKKKAIMNFSILSLTAVSALLATRGLKIKDKEIFEGLIELPHLHPKDIKNVMKRLTLTDKIHKTVFDLTEKVQNGKILNLKEVKLLDDKLETIAPGKKLLNKIIPDSHMHNPFEELGKLSLLGLIPVIGGVTGGILGEKLSKQDWKKNLPNKIKEGSYQYLNNIFLCNVGAGIAMFLMNKLKVKSKAVRFAAMLAGVVAAGVVAGNTIANFIGVNVINPIFDKDKKKTKDLNLNIKDINKERHPEALDLCLHVDDIASAGFLSGLKWIGPALPLIYSISGYRAGIGYRNSH